MLTSLEGVMGSGKTLTAVALAYTEFEQNQKRVISNDHLNFPYQFFDIQFFLDTLQGQELSNCVIILDEAYIYLDSRTTAGKLNKLFTYFIVQTRKRGVDMFFCTQHIDIIEKRVRRACDVRGTCRYRGEDPCTRCKGTGQILAKGIYVKCPRCLGGGKTGFATTTFLDLRSGRRTKVKVLGPAYWHLYDTTEIVPFTAKQMKIPVEDL